MNERPAHCGIFNPATSPDDAPNPQANLLAALGRTEAQVLSMATTDPDAGQGLAQLAIEQRVGLVLAVGGDGTVMACATALAGSGVPLAVLPAGLAICSRSTWG